MAQLVLQNGPTSLVTSYRPSHTLSGKLPPGNYHVGYPMGSRAPSWQPPADRTQWQSQRDAFQSHGLNSTGKGILIGMLSAFGSAALVGIIIAIVYFFRYTGRGRILLDRMSRPGEYDDEQAFLREEEEAMAEMDDLQKAEYLRAKGEYMVALKEERITTNIDGSLCPSKPTGVAADRHFLVTIPGHPGERCFSLGIRTGAGNRELFCGSQDRDRVLRFRVQRSK